MRTEYNEHDNLLSVCISMVQSKSIRGLLHHIFQGEFREKFLNSTGGRGRHHSFRGGLAYHTCHASTLAGRILDHYESLGIKINRDIVIAGVLLHDIGKVECYEYDRHMPQPSPVRGNVMLAVHVTGGWKETKAAKMFHHIPIGYGKLLLAAREYNQDNDINEIEQEDLDHLLHIILSHHGKKGWSSPVIPQTTEAYVVHSIEMMDGYVDSYNNGTIPREIYGH